MAKAEVSNPSQRERAFFSTEEFDYKIPEPSAADIRMGELALLSFDKE